MRLRTDGLICSKGISSMDGIETVNRFWQEVWNPPYDFSMIDHCISEDFVITSAGQDIRSRAAFKEWIIRFQSNILDLHLTPIETFASADGSRIVSRWHITGKNHGMLGTPADGRAISLTGIAIWAFEDGWLTHNWVERSAFEVFQTLSRLP